MRSPLSSTGPLNQLAFVNSLHMPPRHGPEKKIWASPQLCSLPLLKNGSWLNLVACYRGQGQGQSGRIWAFSFKSKALQSKVRVGMVSGEVGLCLFQAFKVTFRPGLRDNLLNCLPPLSQAPSFSLWIRICGLHAIPCCTFSNLTRKSVNVGRRTRGGERWRNAAPFFHCLRSCYSTGSQEPGKAPLGALRGLSGLPRTWACSGDVITLDLYMAFRFQPPHCFGWERLTR